MTALSWSVATGEARAVLAARPDQHYQCCVTSPPYFGLRDYGHADQLGLEDSVDDYVARLVATLAEVRRVLRRDGTLWLNLGDSYVAQYNGSPGTTDRSLASAKCAGRASANRASRLGGARRGLPRKSLVGVPFRVALALQADGWLWRSLVVWQKPNPPPIGGRDRPVTAHEYVLLFSRGPRYYYDDLAERTPLRERTVSTYSRTSPERVAEGRRPRMVRGAAATEHLRHSLAEHRPAVRADGTPLGARLTTVWTIANRSVRTDHSSTYPVRLAERCVLLGTRPGDRVLDPFCGTGTTGLAALRCGCSFDGVELLPETAEGARARLRAAVPLLAREE